MKPLPTDPMRVHNRFIAAFCDDLFDMVVHGTKGTPRADAVYALDRELNQQALREREAGNSLPNDQ